MYLVFLEVVMSKTIDFIDPEVVILDLKIQNRDWKLRAKIFLMILILTQQRGLPLMANTEVRVKGLMGLRSNFLN